MDDVIGKLIQFGLSTYEAKAYVALLQKHPAIGYEVSKIAKTPTAKIYETLNSLKNKGIVYSNASEPVLYCPVDPDILLRRIQADFDSRINTLEDQLQKIAPVPDADVIWNLSGYQVILEKSIEIISRAKSELLVSIWPQDAEFLNEHLQNARRRDVRVIAGVFGEFDIEDVDTVNLDTCGESSRKRLGKRLTVWWLATQKKRSSVKWIWNRTLRAFGRRLPVLF